MKTVVEKPPREAGKAMSICFKNGFRIYPVPYSASRYKIVTERPRKDPLESEETYSVKPGRNQTGLWEKIEELYGTIAARIEKNRKSVNTLNYDH